jgi:SAM-dependent methyltransferase
MQEDYQEIIRRGIVDNPAFVSATFSGRQRGTSPQWKRVVIRPVSIRGQLHLRFSYFDERKDISKNYTGAEIAAQLNAALQLPFRNFHVRTQDENIQVTLSKRGRPLISRSAAESPGTIDLSHDRQKDHLLAEGDDIPFLRAVGIMTADNLIRAKQRDKFRQINAFLRILAEVDEIAQLPEPLRVVDFGCGKAYLTFAAYNFLTHVMGKGVELTGVDVREDLQAHNQEIGQELGWHNLRFDTGTIAEYESTHPADIVAALHACDTATDDALARAIHWGSRVILAAPCCHHHLQAQIRQQTTPAPFEPVMRYGLLRERLGDILTDTFRIQILRIMGYRVDALEFVSVEHTPRNLLIRAVRTESEANPQHAQEYCQMQAFWNVTPYLHQLLGAELDAAL